MEQRKRITLALVFALLAVALAACSAGQATVSGTVTYRERMALPPGTLVNVQLQDVSLADAPATVIGEQDIVIEDEQVPIPFEIAYDPDDIEDNHTYVVRAEIRDAEGNLLFTTDTSYPVITRDNPTEGVEIVVVAVGR